MDIIFNTGVDGLGNNGGSKTIIRCAETLAALNNNVKIYTSINKYSWHSISKNVEIINSKKPCPKCDVLISASHKDAKIARNIKCHHRLYYIRGFETWKAPPKQLFAEYKKHHCIVNSKWLKNKLAKNKINSEIIYPGLDFDVFYDLQLNRQIDIGAIFHKKHATKRHKDAQQLSQSNGYSIELLNKDIVKPDGKSLNEWYNKIKVWFAPTELEGLHNPPMEAMLAGCTVVRTSHKLCGMKDYAINKKTALVYEARNLKAAKKCIDELLHNDTLRHILTQNAQHLLKNKIGSRPQNMQKLVSYIKTL